MNRPNFTTRIKGKRDKFAASRASLSESWDQSFCDDEGSVPGFPDLPSPTIGGDKDIQIGGFDSFSTPTKATTSSTTTTFPLTPTHTTSSYELGGIQPHHGGSGSGSSVEPSPRSSADPAVPISLWKRHVGIQCSLPVQLEPFTQLTRKLFSDTNQIHEYSYYHPYMPTLKDVSHQKLRRRRMSKVQYLLNSRYTSKSLDWDDFPEKFHSQLWEPFCALGDDIVYWSQTPSNILCTGEIKHEAIQAEITSCEKCLNLATSTLKDDIGNLKSNLIQSIDPLHVDSIPIISKSSIELFPTICEANTTMAITSTTTSVLSQSPRRSRPSLGFTLPIPQQINSQPSPPIITKSKLVPIVTEGSRHPLPKHIHSASLDQGTTVEKLGHAEGREKSSTLPTIDNRHIVAIRNAEKRRRFFARKQTNSAPDSFEASTFFNVTTHGVINTTRRFCGNCKEPVTNCLDGVLRATRREKADPSTMTPTVEVWESEIRTARCGDVAVTHVSELDFPDADPPCHFCCEQASTAIHDESRLQIVSGGLVRSRDGSTRGGAGPYINLPSPNVQAENGAEAVGFGSIADLSPSISQTLSPGTHNRHHHPYVENRTGSVPNQTNNGCGSPGSSGSGNHGKLKTDDEGPFIGPPVSSLTRRPALVPPKIMSDADYENDSERDKSSSRNSDDNTSPRIRRSSIVVIPPMQICPGDLLVYGKCLSQRKSLLGTTIESPSPVTSMFEPDNTASRKTKPSWSLMKLFERSSRTKGGGGGTLEEIMSILQPCDFSDPKLSRFKGMCWSDFASYVVNSKCKLSLTSSVTSPQEEDDYMLPQITGSLADPKLILPTKIGTSPTNNTSVGSNTSPCETLLVNTTAIVTGTASTSTTSTGKETSTDSILQSIAKGPKKPESSPKPQVRKRMGLMRTMSDRCLERRITPALWRATPGFLLGEKLVEGKESEGSSCSSVKSNGTKTITSSPSKSTTIGKPSPLLPTKSEKDFYANIPTISSLPSQNIPISTEEEPNTSQIKLSSSDLNHRQKLRQKEALWDLFQSECSFLYDHLMVLKNVFLEPLKRIQVEGFAMYAEPELLFGNLDELCCVTYGFCKEFIHLLLKLTNKTGELSTTEVLAKLFEPSSKARAMSQAYHRYALNYINALNYLETLRRHAEFGEFEKFCMRDPRCKKLQLTDLLVSPVQHIMKVPLILKDIQSRTNQPQEKELIAQILEIQENSIRELDDKMRWLKNFERLLEIQRNIVWPSILEMEPKTWVPDFLRVALSRQPCDSLVVSPRRQIIHEGLLMLWDTGKPTETYAILFDDMFLITRRKKGLSKKKSSLTENWASSYGKNTGVIGSGLETNHRYIVYRQPISLDRFFIHDIGDAENVTAKLDFAFVLVSLNRFQQIVSVHTFQSTSDTGKATWLQKLKATQDKWKRTLQNTVFRGVRNSTDSTQSNVASSLLGNTTSPKSFLRRET